MKIIVLAVLALAATAWSAAVPKKVAHLPPYFETCQRGQPDVDSCILQSLKNLLPYLVKGVPELDLPPIDPLVTEEILLGYANGHIDGKAIIKDYTTRGLRNLQFLAVKSNFEDLDNFELQIELFIPKTTGDGNYKLQGRFLTSEFGGRGIHNITMGNISMTWTLTGSQQVIDGIRYMRIKHFDMDPEVGDMKVYFSNLFNGNEALSKSALKLFNQYWRIVYKELLPYAKEGSDKILRDIANRVFLKVPFDEIFPLSSQ